MPICAKRSAKVLVMFAAAAGCIFGQLDRGSITGKITDPAGAVVTHSKVTATNVDTNVTLTTASTSTGDYALQALIVGRYRVQVETAGFKRAVQENVQVSAGSTVRLDVSLEIGSVADVMNPKVKNRSLR